MELNSQTAERLLEMINGGDSEDRYMAYEMLHDHLLLDPHQMKLRYHAGYALIILKMDTKSFIIETEETTKRKKILKAYINEFDFSDDGVHIFFTYNGILRIIRQINASDDQKKFVLKYMIKSLERDLNIEHNG